LAGTDFFTAEVLTLRGLVTYYVLFFIHLESRRVDIAGIAPASPWLEMINRVLARCPNDLRSLLYSL
jgi:putative transposase